VAAVTLRDLAEERELRDLVGRENELAVLLRTLDESGPLVTFVHGIAGIGKSTLLGAFAARARERGATVIRIDCASIEPTARGFSGEIRRSTGEPADADPLLRLAALTDRVVLAVDTYEAFRVSETWLRKTLIPALPGNTRLLIAGRDAPSIAWFAPIGLGGSLSVLELGPLADDAARALLRAAGLTDEAARRIHRVTRGHPLALRVAAAGAAAMPGAELEEVAAQRVVEELAGPYLEGLDPSTRRALEAASLVRRINLSLLAAILPDAAPQDAYDRLLDLPFVRQLTDGLALHETMQQAIAIRLRAEDPSRHRSYRQAAWRCLRDELRDAGAAELWRYTADMLYLIENPITREAFFPSGAQLCAVEPARTTDAAAIFETIARHDGPRSAAILHGWWERAPEVFRAVRDRNGDTAGFTMLFETSSVPRSRWPHDPLVEAWLDHMRGEPVPRGQLVLFSRRLLDRTLGEGSGATQGAVFLDTKRLYMELRPRLRRVYWAGRSVLDLLPALGTMGFVRVPEADLDFDGQRFHTVMLDFGPGSVDEWLAHIAAHELGIPQDDLLDLESREIVLEGERFALSRLEFALLRYLMEREGKTVSRADLLADVWGYRYEGDSNVVDVAIRALRRKLGDRSDVITTVRGTGYRYRRV
jgi:transcriptional regulator/AAA ATPase-like protein